MTTSNGVKRPVGAPIGSNKGNKFHETHGIVTFRNQIKRRVRRGRSLIDRRSTAGRNAVALRQELILDQGGEEHLSMAKLALIEMIARDVYFLDECDRRIFRAMNERMRKGLKHPKLIGTMYGYRSGVARNLAANLAMLGLEKRPPPAKTLDEILAEDQDEQEA
jgi:hypothetical protein